MATERFVKMLQPQMHPHCSRASKLLAASVAFVHKHLEYSAPSLLSSFNIEQKLAFKSFKQWLLWHRPHLNWILYLNNWTQTKEQTTLYCYRELCLNSRYRSQGSNFIKTVLLQIRAQSHIVAADTIVVFDQRDMSLRKSLPNLAFSFSCPFSGSTNSFLLIMVSSRPLPKYSVKTWNLH